MKDDSGKGNECCGCIPILNGMITIGVLSVLYVTAYFIISIILFWNYEFTHWWFPLVTLSFIIGLGFTSCYFIFAYWITPSRESAKNQRLAMILIATMNFLIFVWCMTYV